MAHLDTLALTGEGALSPSDASPEVDLDTVLLACVTRGEPLYVQTPLNEHLSRMHWATIARLQAATGLPVRVVYFPAG